MRRPAGCVRHRLKLADRAIDADVDGRDAADTLVMWRCSRRLGQCWPVASMAVLIACGGMMVVGEVGLTFRHLHRRAGIRLHGRKGQQERQQREEDAAECGHGVLIARP